MIVSDDEIRAEFKQIVGVVVSEDDINRIRDAVETEVAADFPNCSSSEIKSACLYLIVSRLLGTYRARGAAQADEGYYLELYKMRLPSLKNLNTQRANKKVIEAPPTSNYTITMKDKVKKGNYYG